LKSVVSAAKSPKVGVLEEAKKRRLHGVNAQSLPRETLWVFERVIMKNLQAQ
jgi:hypothetical protein